MKKIYIACLVFCLTFFTTQKILAQVTSYNFIAAPETFQPVNGTVVSFISEDDTYHPNLPIGFNFIYNGNTTDRFGICTNGYIVLDSLIHSITMVPASPALNSISPFMTDLYINFGSTIEYVTTGTAPNRVLTIQWKNVGLYFLPGVNINFQVMLFETTNCIKFIYGTCTSIQPATRNCYVGLIGNSLTDFNTRSSMINDWTVTSAAPLLMNSFLTFGSTSILPSGLAYYFGCLASSSAFSYLTGNVFLDSNNNGIKDTGENGIQNYLVHETNHNIYAMTDSFGNYSMYFPDSTLSYHLTMTSYTYWNISTSPVSYTVIPLTQSCNNLDFGMYPTPNVVDVQIAGPVNVNVVPGLNTNLGIIYRNNGTTIQSGTIQLVKSNFFTVVSATPAAGSVSGDTLTWNYSNLQLLEVRTIILQLHTDTTAVIGDTLHSFWSITPSATDVEQANNNWHTTHCVRISLDPNMKSVSPAGNILNGTPLQYTIHFQNTGTATAMNVMILDTLDSNLNPSSLVIEGSSHPLTFWTMTGSGNLRFVFQNIMLPDSNSNEPESHGYISYRIDPLPSLSFNTVISNTAHIFFDFNSAVVTNTITSTITELVTSLENNSGLTSGSLLIYPNPFSESAAMVFEMQPGKNYSLEIVSPDGKLVRAIENVSSGKIFIEKKNISPGIYFVQLRSGNEIEASGKLVVE